jgi:pimeloyl-ACP methyl ester carboxylesterase
MKPYLDRASIRMGFGAARNPSWLLLAAAFSLWLASCASLTTNQRATTADGEFAYKLEGSGSPFVVFQSGLGDGADVWGKVLPATAAKTSAIAYDRLGYGGSASPRNARDPCTIASEQRAMLKAINAQRPFVLVGHSFGGLYQYVYAKLFPEDVAALILVDATHPDHWKRMQEDAPATATAMKSMSIFFGAAMKSEFSDQAACLERIDKQPLRMPVRLLVRSNFALPERGAFENMVLKLQKEWQTLTGVSRIEKIDGSGHYIQKEKPEAVVRAIAETIDESRKKK